MVTVEPTRVRPMIGTAIASPLLAVAAAVVMWMGLWVVAIVCAIAGISTSIQARRSLRLDSSLRGTTLSLIGFLASAVVLFFGLWPGVLYYWGLIIASLSLS